jgi:hypothetical protein
MLYRFQKLKSVLLDKNIMFQGLGRKKLVSGYFPVILIDGMISNRIDGAAAGIRTVKPLALYTSSGLSVH